MADADIGADAHVIAEDAGRADHAVGADMAAPLDLDSRTDHGMSIDGAALAEARGRIKGSATFRVRVVDANGRTVRMFTYPTIESARRAARAWTVAYGNCPIVDKSGVKE